MLAIMLLFAVVAIGIRCLPASRSVALSRRVKFRFGKPCSCRHCISYIRISTHWMLLIILPNEPISRWLEKENQRENERGG